MKRLGDATRKKAEMIFSQYDSIVTGQGLSRRELRQMEREGFLESRLMKNKDTGAIIRQWNPISLAKEIIKKACK